MSILVVGSVALDCLETPFGRAVDTLGGSAVYFAAAASLYARVNLVAVVGTDFPADELRFLSDRGVDVRGLQVQEGRTFRWAGRYDYERGVCETLDTQLNVFAEFHPTLPQGYEASDLVFLANIDPDLQYEVLTQVKGARLTMLDTMNFWIQGKRGSLLRVMGMVDVVTLNAEEVRLLAGDTNTLAAAKKVLEIGPRAVIVKKGEHGALLLSEDTYFVAPAYPLEMVKDPTGAGDSFAGGFLGYLAELGEVTPKAMRRALVQGSALASFTVQEFGPERLRTLSRQEVEGRYQEFRLFARLDD